MAEFIMKDMLKKEGLEREFEIASAATSREAEGSPVSGPVRTILSEMGISCSGKTARKLTPDDYNNYDLIIGMDEDNIHDMRRIFGGNSKGKLHLLLEYAGCADSVADPWYTCDYEATRRDVIAGCKGLLEHLTKTKES
jgi:protein-tyrosine phosphatase